jgi:HAD superfamily hydrolase (TIGR01509 family)
VLVDSEAIANRIMAEHITATGIPIAYEDCRARFVGGTLQRVMDTVEQWLGKPLPPGWKDDFEARRNEAFRRELKAVAGVEEVLQRLARVGTEICVASSGTIEKMELTLGLTGLKRYFGERLFSASMVAHGKPEPDIFLYAAEQMGYLPETCVVVEDSPTGVTAAVAAGMRVLAYAADTDAEILRVAGAHPFAEMAELPGLLGLDADLRERAGQVTSGQM